MSSIDGQAWASLTANAYYADDQTILFHGDFREVTEWLAADVLVFDPPYGRDWRQGDLGGGAHAGIAGDEDTSVRDIALAMWAQSQGPPRCVVCFGDLMMAPPLGTKQVLVYAKGSNHGLRGATGGFRRDAEAIYLIGPWRSGIGGDTSVVRTRSQTGATGVTARHGHPHAKPGDVMEPLIGHCPPGVIADPTAGSGSTLVAARNMGRKAIGVEIEEEHCERAAKRLSQSPIQLMYEEVPSALWLQGDIND